MASFFWGDQCASNYPTVFTKVNSFYNWVIENTHDATYCQHPIWKTYLMEKSTTILQTLTKVKITTQKPTGNSTQKTIENTAKTTKLKLLSTTLKLGSGSIDDKIIKCSLYFLNLITIFFCNANLIIK